MFEDVAAKVRQAAVQALQNEAEEVASLARSRARGSLAGNISVELEQDGDSHWTATVFSADPYGRAGDSKAKDPSKYNVPAFQEFGTRYQAARPYMRPALEDRRENLPEAIGAAVTNAAQHTRSGGVRRKVRVTLKAG